MFIFRGSEKDQFLYHVENSFYTIAQKSPVQFDSSLVLIEKCKWIRFVENWASDCRQSDQSQTKRVAS